MCVCMRERESVCVCVCLCVREREREYNIQLYTTLLSLCREMCHLVHHLHKTFRFPVFTEDQ